VTEIDEAPCRVERLAAPRTSGHLDVDEPSHHEDEPSSQVVPIISPSTSTDLANDTHGFQQSDALAQDKAWQKVVCSIQSTVDTIETHKDAWIRSSCTFTALVGSSGRASMVTRSSYDSSEAIISELADTFAQVEGDIHQRHIFKKLLAYTVNTMWAGKHFISNKSVRKLRTYGSTARNLVAAADNVPSILLLASPSW